MYREITHGVAVTVEPFFLDDESDPDERRFFWAYHVRIENQGPETVQLMTRYWRITDAAGKILEVQGDGVVGEQPVLDPGEAFEYTSGTPLGTPSGFMVGRYVMAAGDGRTFEVDIPAFSLDSPHQDRALAVIWKEQPVSTYDTSPVLPASERPTRAEAEQADPHLAALGRRRSRPAKACWTRPGRVARGLSRNGSSAATTSDPGGHSQTHLRGDRRLRRDGPAASDIRFESHCEHHMAPIIGKAHVAYLPKSPGRRHQQARANRRGIYAHRLQIQEKMTVQIADNINEILQPKGVAVVIEAVASLHDDARRAQGTVSP